MRTRVAVMAIIVEKPEAVEQMNTLLHGYALSSAGWASRTGSAASTWCPWRWTRRRTRSRRWPENSATSKD